MSKNLKKINSQKVNDVYQTNKKTNSQNNEKQPKLWA